MRKPLNILIVEDNEDLAKSISDLMQIKGYNVIDIKPDNAGGIDIVKQSNIDIVILDGNLADGSNTIFFTALEDLEAETNFKRPKHILVNSGSNSAITMAGMFGAEGFDKMKPSFLYNRIDEIAAE